MLRLFLLVACATVALGAHLKMKPTVLGPRIVNGHPVDIEFRRYQLSFRQIIDAQRFAHFCGASILSKRVALTAAHCTAGKDPKLVKLAVVAGITKLNEFPEQQLMVKQIIDHPDYSKAKQYDCDISLLILDGEFIYNQNVGAIILPTGPVKPDTKLVVSGWGRLSESGSTPIDLQEVEVFCFKTEECIKDYGSRISGNMFCAGKRAGGEDSCQGDSGGPITRGEVQEGIVSWGVGCARPNQPGVYTALFNFKQWIASYSYLF